MPKPASWLSARDAAALLDVKLATLYSYTSRGWIESVPAPGGRGRRYDRSSLERLKKRHDARSGHGAVAASALSFGEPSIETSISDLREDGPYYRGHSAVELCERGVPFESVFDLLVEGALSEGPDWSSQLSAALPSAVEQALRGSRVPADPCARHAALLGVLALHDPKRHGASDAGEQTRARQVAVWLAARAGTATTPASAKSVSHARIAELVLRSLGCPPTAATVEVIDRVLILCADHELNASTFTARIAASTGADLYACLSAAMHTLSGGRHGGASARVEALLREIDRPARAASVLRERFARGENTPGFGHPLYPDGDPRGHALVTLAERVATRSKHKLPEL
ncbi:MAG: citrate/2-methylcitrate synthase, partial [Polyangiales bacterium]